MLCFLTFHCTSVIYGRHIYVCMLSSLRRLMYSAPSRTNYFNLIFFLTVYFKPARAHCDGFAMKKGLQLMGRMIFLLTCILYI